MVWQLQGFDTNEFLQNYWQQKPCLIRQAFPGTQSPLSPEELAGLACEQAVHSRLVIEKDADHPWQLSYGPFAEEDFLALPDTHYSLLVSECEKWIPEFAELLQQFYFIPSWRIDDLMVSYAPHGGSVGPHVDEYDVFLLQLQGQREWQYSDERVENPQLIEGPELAILQDFNPDQEAILDPGDMLYLPPGIAHHGVALEACLTCSIGFRAPDANEVLESMALEIDRQNLGAQRYTDAGLEKRSHHAEISDKEVHKLRLLATSLLDQPDDLWVDATGRLLSDSIIDTASIEPRPARFEDIEKYAWMVNPDSKMLYHCGTDLIQFFCNGHSYPLPNSRLVLESLQSICDRGLLSESTIENCSKQEGLMRMLLELINTSAIIQVDDHE
jgi:50S ribosomal protein L16 3-hydroxylase